MNDYSKKKIVFEKPYRQMQYKYDLFYKKLIRLEKNEKFWSKYSTLEGMEKIYNSITKAPIKAMARRIGAEHEDMLYIADGYTTAWFMWHLQGDEDASKAFVGNDAEC